MPATVLAAGDHFVLPSHACPDLWLEVDGATVTAETRNMIGRAELAAMAPGTVFVNCARGALLDDEAVYDALRSGHLFGAAFDVFEPEPPPSDSPVQDLPNVVVTPHVAGASMQTAEKAARIVAGDVGRFRRGEPLAHCANPEVLATAGSDARG